MDRLTKEWGDRINACQSIEDVRLLLAEVSQIQSEEVFTHGVADDLLLKAIEVLGGVETGAVFRDLFGNTGKWYE